MPTRVKQDQIQDNLIVQNSLKQEILNPKVSVIVHVCNTDKYLFKCLMSLIKQTLKEIEIIIAYDSIGDNSLSIVSKFAKEDYRIKVITREDILKNSAENADIEITKGEYVGFVDSADWVDFDYFEKLYNAAKKHNLDIALASKVKFGKYKSKKPLNITDEKIAVSMQDKVDISRQWENDCPSNKIYRNSILKNNNINWAENYEDKLFTIQAVYYANGIVSVPKVNYFKNSNIRARKHSKQLITGKNREECSVISFLKEKKAQLRDKDFWEVNKECRLGGIPLFKRKESLYTCQYQLFNFPILTVEDTEEYKIQNFIGNLIHTKKIKSEIKEHKLIKFLGIPIFERNTDDNICRYYCFGHLIKQFHLADAFFKGCLKNVKFDYDDIYLLHGNSGEVYLFFAYIANAFLKKNGSKNPLFVATKKYHIEILQLYYPQAKYIYINNVKIKTQSDKWVVNGHNIYILFSSNYFLKIEFDIRNNEIGKIHYLNNILTTLGLTENDYREMQAHISDKVYKSVESKINEIQLKINNFIILAPEALTCQELSKSFWVKLADKLHQNGYDIFVNAMKQENKIEGCKSIFLNYQEILCLAKKAKAVISLRSGLSENLLQARIPNITIYTKFRERKKSIDINKTIASFSLMKLPFVSEEKIVEINSEEFLNEDELLNKTLDSLKSMLNNE